MAIPSIGGNTFMTMSAAVPDRGMKVQDITRPGGTGSAILELGESGDETILYTQVDFTSASQRNTALTGYEGLKGDLVTVVDMFGRSLSNVMVLDVKEVSTRVMAQAVGGRASGTYLLTCMWRLKKT